MTVNGAIQWNRHAYPLQPSIKGPAPQSLPTQPPEREDNPPVKEEKPPKKEEEQPPPQPLQDIHATSEVNPWNRHTYPLQSTVMGATLPNLQTVPPEKGNEPSVKDSKPPAEEDMLPPVQSSTGIPATDRVSSWARQRYPLQSPSKGSSPQHVTAPSPEGEFMPSRKVNEALKIDTEPPRKVNGLDSFQHVSRADPLGQHHYSLLPSSENLVPQYYPVSPPGREDKARSVQLPQSIQAVYDTTHTYTTQSSVTDPAQQHSPTSTLLASEDDNPTPVQSSLSNTPAQDTNARQRRLYPAQSFIRDSLSQFSSAPTSTLLASENGNRTPVPHSMNNTSAHDTNVRRRRLYPAQSFIRDSRSQFSSASTLAEESHAPSDEEVQTSSVQLKGNAQNGTANVLNPWNRHVYPLQSSTEDFIPQHILPTPPPEDDGYSIPLHLPKNIRADVNSENPATTGRTIVLMLDGTGDKFDCDNSNIVHLVSCLKKDDASQVTYYQAGIGTYSTMGLSSGISAAFDMAIGSELGLHVRDAYHFLMHSYKEGDKICIFGFSRGAYTARCLAGMIHKVGLLPPRNIQQIPFAYEFYANDTQEGWDQSNEFKKTFCTDVSVYFLGAFDSVASVGIIPRQLPLSSTPFSKPRYFRHAMALDERRAKFKVCRHQTKDWDDITKSTISTSVPAMHRKSLSSGVLSDHKSLNETLPTRPHRPHDRISDEEYERQTGHQKPYDTDVLEVWFLGAHADVGGGAVKNVERHKLSNIPLRWMIRQCFECNTGIIFKTHALAENGIDVHMLWPKYRRLSVPDLNPPPSLLEKYEEGLLPPRSCRPAKLVPIAKPEKGEEIYRLTIFEEEKSKSEEWLPEQVEDYFDSLSPLNDQLVDARAWWILEFWPVEYKLPKKDSDEFYTQFGMNLGRYRAVEDADPNLHWTVRHRMHSKNYKINARTGRHARWRTVV